MTAIIPAYKEGNHIHRVLDVVTAYDGFSEIIVVGYDPSGKTAAVVKRYPRVHYLLQTASDGKGQALAIGVQASHNDVLFFCDADVIGLTLPIIDQIVRPVLNGSVAMSIAARGRSMPRLIAWMARVAPRLTLIGGERALRKELWQQMPDRFKKGFRLEIGLNTYALKHQNGLTYQVFPTLRQTIKEQKYTLPEALYRRWQLIRDVTTAWLMGYR